MPLVLGCLALAFPRLVFALVVVFSDYIGSAFDHFLWPLLGFFFLPLTTLAYAFAIHSNGELGGVYLVLVFVSVLIDLGLVGAGAKSRRKKKRDDD